MTCLLCGAVNPYAADGYFGQNKMMQKSSKCSKHYHMGTHSRVLSESFPMNSNMTGFRCFSKNICSLDESSLSTRRVKAASMSKSCCKTKSGVK